MLQRLTLDIICAQAFAMDTDFQNKTDDVLFRSAETIFELEYKSKVMLFGLCFPELGIFAMAINFLKMFFANNGTIPPLTITSAVEEVIKQRRKDPSSRKPDLLQLLIDASAADTDETSQASNSSGTKGGDSTPIRRKRKHLTDLEIKSNALVVFLAGYETTSSALAFAFHFLVKHPEFQKRIQAEIDHLIKTEGELNYYTVTSLQQIERVLLETMRLYPPAANFVNRIAVTDVNYDDLYIPKGLQIDVPVYYMHHSPDYWPRPEVFDPDRFLPENRTENQTMSYFAFGIGPRNCIGARLVHISTKVIMAKILQKFTVLSTDTKYETNGAVATKLKVGTLVP
ncbi:Cytochrome P450 3A13, partial [Stegodyphus mimosarum]